MFPAFSCSLPFLYRSLAVYLTVFQVPSCPCSLLCLNRSLAVYLVTDRFDEIPAAEYYDHGKRVGVPQQSQLSAKETLKCLVHTIQSYSTQEKLPSIIVVGTHLDKLEEKMK